MRLIQVAFFALLTLQLQLYNASAEPPSNFSASTSTESNSNLESSTGSTVKSGNGKDTGKDPKDLKPYLEPPSNKKRRPFWRSRYWPRRPFSRPNKEKQQEKEEQQSFSQPQPTPTPDPTALTNFLAAAAFLIQNQQQQTNKFNNQPAANSISQPQQPVVGPFTYSQMSNVYKDGQPIPSQIFSSFSGPSPSFSSPIPSGPSSPFIGSGPSSSSVVGPSGFSARRPTGNGFQSHYTNPNASPYQPSSIATSFFSRPPPKVSQQSSNADYEIAKSHYHPATVLPNSPPTTGPQSTRLFSSSGPTVAGNLSPQSYALQVTSKIQTGSSPSAPGSIHYITPTPHKPYAVTFEPGPKSQMLNTNQLLTESEHFFKQYNKNIGGLPPDQFLKTVSLTGGSSAGSTLPLSYSGSKYVQPSSPSSSPSAPSTAAISNLEEKMNLLLNLVPHLVRSGALPADSLLAPTLDTSKYVVPPASLRPSLSAQDLLFLKLRAGGVAVAPPKTSALSSPSLATGSGSSLAPHESVYYSPSSSLKQQSVGVSPLISASAPSYTDFDSMYDLLANPSSSGTVIRDGPPSSSVEVSDPVIIYHHHSPPSSSPYSSHTHSHSHPPSSAGHHPFAPPPSSSSSMLSSLNEDRPRSAIGSLLSSVRKMIF